MLTSPFTHCINFTWFVGGLLFLGGHFGTSYFLTSIIVGGEQMSKFYCREDELRKMNKRYKGDKFECIVIYGRRRVGKTALINEFCKDNTTIYWNRSLEIKVIL